MGAAIDVKNQRAGLGAVIRDSSDKIVVATTKKKLLNIAIMWYLRKLKLLSGNAVNKGRRFIVCHF